MGRYLKGPFPLGSVLCTYERPLEIQYNTIQYNTIQYNTIQYKQQEAAAKQTKPLTRSAKNSLEQNYYLTNMVDYHLKVGSTNWWTK